jgi:hypothetical protein
VYRNDAIFLAVDLRRLDAVNERHRFIDQRVQVGETLLLAIVLGHIHTGQLGRHSPRKVASDLNLNRKRIHIGKKPCVQERTWVNFPGGGVLFGLAKNRIHGAQHLFKSRD